MKPTLFIIEGPDCSGKSSLAAFICQKYGAAYMHASGAKPLHSAMEAYHLSLIESARKTLSFGVSVVMDRLWPSEYCYGEILRPGMLCKYDFTKVLIALHDLKPVYVFCGDPQNTIRHGANMDPDHPYRAEQFLQICSEYAGLEADLRRPDTAKTLLNGKIPMEFNVWHYSILDHGSNMSEFVEALWK